MGINGSLGYFIKTLTWDRALLILAASFSCLAFAFNAGYSWSSIELVKELQASQKHADESRQQANIRIQRLQDSLLAHSNTDIHPGAVRRETLEAWMSEMRRRLERIEEKID